MIITNEFDLIHNSSLKVVTYTHTFQHGANLRIGRINEIGLNLTTRWREIVDMQQIESLSVTSTSMRLQKFTPEIESLNFQE
jgi:hypothetical protein